MVRSLVGIAGEQAQGARCKEGLLVSGWERRARQLLERKGYRFATVADRAQVSQQLLAEVARVAREQAVYARDLGDIRRLEDVTEQFAARSRLFRARGLSLDTSILPSLAIERSLGELRARGLVAANSVREVAVIGPGLDFSDKGSGYDFYPQQTLQPFTLMDSLVRLGLTDRTNPAHVTTLDLSPRVNDHLTRARQRASRLHTGSTCGAAATAVLPPRFVRPGPTESRRRRHQSGSRPSGH